MDTTEMKREVARMIGRRDNIMDRSGTVSIQMKKENKKRDDATKARWLLTETIRITQAAFKSKIERFVSMMLRAVYNERDIYFVVNIEQKKNRMECHLLVRDGKDGELFVPKDEEAGGLMDMISIALRIVMWSMERPRSRNILILDEPLKFVGKGWRLAAACDVLKTISKRMGIQMLLITHEPEIAMYSDKSFWVSHNGIHSIVEEGTIL